MRKTAFKLLTTISIILITSLSTYADWVKGYYTAEAGIDSLERIIILTDPIDTTDMGIHMINAGDQNSDGIDDIICVRRLISTSTINLYGYLFYGGFVVDSLPDKELPGFTIYSGNIGDIDDDGIDDFSDLAYPNFEIYFGGSELSTNPDFIFENMLSFSSRVGDFNGDGILELAVSKDLYGGYVNIYRIDSLRDTIPEYVLPDTTINFGENLCTSDFNGDGFDDLAVAAFSNLDTPFVNIYFGGLDFDTIPDLHFKSTAPQFGTKIVPVEDFNGDGYSDFIIVNGADQRHGLYFGGPLLDTIIDIPINRVSNSYYFGTKICDDAGDINNDGYSDIVVGYSNETTATYEVYVYLGGPEGDSLPDIYFSDYDVPNNNRFMGDEVCGIGDFNGDGIDDFAVHARPSGKAEVYIFAGWDSNPTDIEQLPAENLPDNFNLYQNPQPLQPVNDYRI